MSDTIEERQQVAATSKGAAFSVQGTNLEPPPPSATPWVDHSTPAEPKKVVTDIPIGEAPPPPSGPIPTETDTYLRQISAQESHMHLRATEESISQSTPTVNANAKIAGCSPDDILNRPKAANNSSLEKGPNVPEEFDMTDRQRHCVANASAPGFLELSGQQQQQQ